MNHGLRRQCLNQNINRQQNTNPKKLLAASCKLNPKATATARTTANTTDYTDWRGSGGFDLLVLFRLASVIVSSVESVHIRVIRGIAVDFVVAVALKPLAGSE
jgi:hypothetical protein